MKKKMILFLSILWVFCAYTQSNLDKIFLKENLLKRDYLFHTLGKERFNKLFDDAFNEIPVNNWDVENLLANFKELNLKIIKDKNDSEIKIKSINDKLYLTSIDKEYNFLLGQKILALNEIPIKKIKAILKEKFYLPHKSIRNKYIEKNLFNPSLIAFLHLNKSDSILIKTANFKAYVPLQSEIISDIEIEKNLFKDLNNNKWFWSYGINYGQQVYLKFNKFLSAEHFFKLKESLKWRNLNYAKNFHTPIQNTYKPLKYMDLINKIHLKFSKRRYKKLIIDLRDNNIGSSYFQDVIIKHINSIKKLHAKNKVYLIVNKNTDFASIHFIQQMKKYFKLTLVGETIYGTDENSNNFDIIELPVSKIKIKIPLNHQKEIEIKPDFTVYQTIKQTTKGIDASLNKCLE
jgi:hypothetical protein